MSTAEILRKAQTMGVRLRLEGDRVKIVGPVLAVALIKPEIAGHKPEIVAYLQNAANDPAGCIGALIAPDGGLYLPWGPRLSPHDVRRIRADLVAMIEALAAAEGWPRDTLDDVMARAMRGPLYDLMPNIAHFRERTDMLRIEQAARDVLNRRT